MKKMRFVKYLLAAASLVCALTLAVSCDKDKNKDNGDDDQTTHTHTYGEWSVTEATCTAAGEKTRKCSGCDVEEKVTINALGHDERSFEAKAPTCTEVGYEAYVACTRCNYTTKVELSKTNHEEITHEAKEPTCTEVGNEAYVTCKNCDYTTYVEIPTVAHEEVTHEAKEPTCTEVGNKAYVTCKNCDYTTYEEIPMNHKFENGVCTECGEEECAEHTYGDWYGNTATCQAKGVEYRTCSVCNKTESRETEKLSHKYENKVCIWCGKKDYTLPPQPLGED